jgi:mono/diheme cytochrome c family protein
MFVPKFQGRQMMHGSRLSRSMVLAVLIAGLFAAAVYARQASSVAQEQRPGSNPIGPEAKLTEQQFKGENLFYQRCSLCHMARALKAGNPPTVGPSLKTVFKNTSPDEEKDLRTFILNGTPHMPGFRYALSSKEIDDLIAYLKIM